MSQIVSEVLHLGCGRKKEPGSFGVDLVDFPEVDLVHDLEKFPYPLPDNQFKKVIVVDVLEHLDKIVSAMEEIHRVCRNGAEVVITGPFAHSMDRHHDPTHRRGFTRLSFDYFIEGTELFKRYGYSKSTFSKKSWGYCLNSPRLPWRRVTAKLANTFPKFYESNFAQIYPMDYVFFVLEAKK